MRQTQTDKSEIENKVKYMIHLYDCVMENQRNLQCYSFLYHSVVTELLHYACDLVLFM